MLSITFSENIGKPLFPIQKKLPNCGAYALAYYIWAVTALEAPDKSEKPKLFEFDSTDEPDFVMDIYEKIKPRMKISGFSSEDSNPARMMKYLTQADMPCAKKEPVFYCTEQFEPLAKALIDDAKALDDKKVEVKYRSEIPALADGSFFIGVFSEKGQLHYILYKQDADKLYCVNSHNGVIHEAQLVPYEPAYSKATGGVFTGAGILIP